MNNNKKEGKKVTPCLKSPSPPTQELKEEFSKHGWSLTAAVAADKGIIGVAYNITELSQHLDFLHIASYDYHGKWDGQTGHNAPLYPRDDESPEDKMRNVVRRGTGLCFLFSEGGDVVRRGLVEGLVFASICCLC